MKYSIIGAGVAGLTAGLLLAQRDQEVEIFEQDSQVGGIAKTVKYPKFRFDLGGHRFLTKYPEVGHFWRQILGKEFLIVNRQSRIFYQGKFLNYPLQPVDALKLGPLGAAQATLSAVTARISPIKPEETLEDIYINSFGRFLYQKFFESYSQRLWGIHPKKMAPDWGRARVGKLSLLAAIRDAFFPKQAEIKSLVKKFHYPRRGPGQMWEEMAKKIRKRGGKIYLNSPIEMIFHQDQKITAIKVKGQPKHPVNQLICSMPLKDLVNCLLPAVPRSVLTAANQLKYRDYILVALLINKKFIFPDQWIYIQDPGFKCLRIQNINNWSQAMVIAKNKTVLGMEYITNANEPLWKKPDDELAKLGKQEVVKLGFCQTEDIVEAKVVRQKQVYPIYDSGYRKHLEVVKNYLSVIKNLTLIGRNGQHKYNNMDHSVLMAIWAVENFFGAKNDVWGVNPEKEYLERKQ